MITIVSTWVNHPEVLKVHRDLWVKAFDESVRYIAYIDAKDYGDFSNFGDATIKHQLVQACIDNSIEYVIIPQEFHVQRSRVFRNCQIASDNTPSGRNALVCQYAWNREVLDGNSKRIIFVQSDIFPYKLLGWNSMTRGSEFYYKPQERVSDGKRIDYAWEGLCMFDISQWTLDKKLLVNFEYGFQKGVYTDTGGGLWSILESLDNDKKFGWSGQNSLQWSDNDEYIPDLPFWIMEHLRSDPRNKVENNTTWYYSEIQDNRCFHLRAGGNWDSIGKEIHDTRYNNFLKVLDDAVKDGTVFI